MLRITKTFPAIRASWPAAIRPGETVRSEAIQLPAEATHYSASASLLKATDLVRVRVSLERGGPIHWTNEEIFDLPCPGAVRTGWRPLAARSLRVALDITSSGQAVLGPVELVPAVGEEDREGAAGKEPVSR